MRGLSHLIPVNLLFRVTERLAPAYARLRSGLAAPVAQRMVRCFKGHTMPASAQVMARSYAARDVRKSMDDLVMRRLSTRNLSNCATIRGIEFLDEALAEGNGVIVISGHFHANRVAKYYLRRVGYPIMSIRNRIPTSPAKSKFGNRVVAPAYGRFLNAVIEDEIHIQHKGIGAGLLRRLRENGIVNIHIDATFSKEKIPLRCLNELRLFSRGFLRLAELTAVPLVPMNCLGNSSAFEIHFGKPIRYTGTSSPEVFRERMASLAALLESWVLAHPEEWEMWHRREIIVAETGQESTP